MSKIRQHVPDADDAIEIPIEGDLAGYVVFTQLKEAGPFIYAGWLNAADDEMALIFAREHYGQDQKCSAIWTIRKDHIVGTESMFAPRAPDTALPGATWHVFHQTNDNAPLRSTGTVVADTGAAALAELGDPGSEHGARYWAVRADHLIATDADDLIWRNTDQTYRLARGYARIVREKWERVREHEAYESYERDSIKEAF